MLQVLDTVSLLFCSPNAPFITLLAVDPHVVIRGIEHNLQVTLTLCLQLFKVEVRRDCSATQA